ncbi:MAG: alpha/beta hydrolase-fold protein [Fimbriimonadaceae bacterium]|nr:alpha/beta hydrolase-fold protein [Fimbriimonadaceae bacterium]
MLCALVSLFLAAVPFTLDAPDAKAVSWVGDLTGWGAAPRPMTRDGATWSILVELPPSGRTEYQFIVDGKWTLDPKNPLRAPNGLGGENSVWEGPDYPHTALAADPKVPLVRTEFSIESKFVPGRKVVMFVPPGAPKELPILVYADGEPYESLARAPHIVKNLIDAGKIRTVVLVLVPPADRAKEYWHDSEPYSRFVVEELLPEVRKRAPCSSRAQDVFLGGASLGGVIALRTAAAYPKAVAGGIHSQSGAFWVEGKDPSWPVDKLAKGLRVFCDWGTFEPQIPASNASLVAALKAKGVDCATFTTPEGHNWTAWRERMERGLVFLLGR